MRDLLSGIIPHIISFLYVMQRITLISLFVIFITLIIIIRIKTKKQFKLIKLNIQNVFDAIIKKLGKWIFGCIIAIVLLSTIKFALTDEVFKILSSYFEKYYDIALILVGAIMSSVVTSIRQKILNKKELSTTKMDDGRMLYYDMLNIRERVLLGKIVVARVGMDNYKFDKINYDNQWKCRYSNISSLLSHEHYEVISNIYSKIEDYNKILNHVDNTKIKRIFDELNQKTSEEYFPDSFRTLSFDEIINDFRRIGDGKQRGNYSIQHLYETLKHIKQIEKYRVVIEKIVHKLIKSGTIKYMVIHGYIIKRNEEEKIFDIGMTKNKSKK